MAITPRPFGMMIVGLAAILCAAGCQIFGLIGSSMPDPTVDPKYKGLKGEHVAVMVWTDRAMSIDWPTLQLDLTRGVSTRLQDMATKKDHPKELEGAKFAAAESVVRYQRDHPEIDTEAITDVAPRLAVTRLIYIEIQQFQTRPEESLELFRGSIAGNLKVIEVKDGKAKITYEEDNIHVAYPSKSPEEGVTALGDMQVYEKTLNAFATQIMNRFVTHTEPRNDPLSNSETPANQL